MTTRRNIPFPEAGEGAIIAFSFEDLETLEAHFGASYWAAMMTALDESSIPAIRKIGETGTKGGDFAAAMKTLPIAEVCMRLLDGLLLIMHGRTAEEHRAHLAHEHAARLKARREVAE